MFTRGKGGITAPKKGDNAGSNYLSRHLVKPDYYTKSETVTGRWIGAQAAAWGIAGNEITAKDKTYGLLNEGFTPDGQKINFPRARKYSFYDFQCSAQKSLSVLAVMMKDDYLIKNVHELAALDAYTELEKFVGWKDQSGGKSAKNDENFNFTGKSCAAMFTHHVGRELQSQVHSHFVIANVVYDENGNARTLDCTQMYEAIRYAGKFYQARCAELLIKAGYDVHLVRKNGVVTGYEIKGVPQRVLDRSDRRRQAIEKAIEEFRLKYGRSPTPSERQDLSLKTREEISIPGFNKKAGMFEASSAKINEYERSLHETEDLLQMEVLRKSAELRRSKPSMENKLAGSPVAARAAVQFAIEHTLERKSVLTRQEVLAEALNQGQGRADVKDIKRALDELEAMQNVLHLDRTGADGLAGRICTDKEFMREQWAIDEINSTMNMCPRLIKDFTPLTRENVEKIAPGNQYLSEKQNEVIRRICASTDRYQALRGDAGAGKTTALTHFHREMKRHKRVVHYCAPTSSATGKLSGEVAAAARVSGVSAMNTMQFIIDSKNLKKCGKFRGAVLVIDEAGLSSNEQGEQVLQSAKRLNMRVIFVGDEKQLKSVQAGDFFRIIQEHSALKESKLHIDEIFRQNPAPEYKAVCEKLAAGQFQHGFDDFDRMGWIHESNDYLKAGAENWLKRHTNGEESIVTAPTWKELGGVTKHIRAGLKATGELNPEDLKYEVSDNFNWTIAQKKDVNNYEIGMFVTALENSGSFLAGRSATIERIEKNNIYLDNGLSVDVLKSGKKFKCGHKREIDIAKGDRILIHQNFKAGFKANKRRDLVNSEFLVISGFDEAGNILTQEGKMIPKSFHSWGHGYAATAHKVQGLSVTSSVGVGERMNGDSWYVICTRGKKSMSFFTPDKARTRAGLNNDGSRISPSDILNMKQRDDLEKSIKERNARNSAKQNLKRDPVKQGRGALPRMRDSSMDDSILRSTKELLVERLRDKTLIGAQREYQFMCSARGVKPEPNRMKIPKQGRGVRTPESRSELERRGKEAFREAARARERSRGMAI